MLRRVSVTWPWIHDSLLESVFSSVRQIFVQMLKRACLRGFRFAIDSTS